jgi:hypothetical protein
MHAEGQRLSYCADCEIIKGRAQTRGFTVAQVQDAFELNTFRALFGDLYHYIAAGTRFDFSGAGAANGSAAAGTPPHWHESVNFTGGRIVEGHGNML